MKLLIREMIEKDMDAVSILFNEYRVFYKNPSDLPRAKQFNTERIIKKESKIFVAEKDNTLCGLIQSYPLFSSTKMKRLWLLNDLFVGTGYHNQGIAKSLLMKAREFSIETKSTGFILETATDNELANLLYKSVGLYKDDSHNYYSFNTN